MKSWQAIDAIKVGRIGSPIHIRRILYRQG